jgi:5-(carboxyamino)imidazole ribonucleotide synthase
LPNFDPVFYRDFKLGILGGGQLGRMLVQACVNYDVETAVLDYDPQGPCRYSPNFAKGDYHKYEDVMAFGQGCDLLTIEIEHVNVQALEVLAAQGKTIYPQPHIIRMVQDKGLQKQFYAEHGIPTAPYRLVESKDQLLAEAEYPLVQKMRTGGYDGQGVRVLNSYEEAAECAFAVPAVLEERIPIKEEISVIVVRNPQGEIQSYPPVGMVFHPQANLVEYLISPAPLPGKVAEQADQIARQIAEKLEIVGLLAVEMFWTTDGRLLVNEIAPRPHNSGHHTIEANMTSQFEQHLRAILGLPLGSTRHYGPAAMLNLLGAEGHSGKPVYNGLEDVLKMTGVKLHLYGKKETRPFRKMGHITLIADSWEEILEKARYIQQNLTVTT